MSLYKILLLTDQQLNSGSNSIDNVEAIDREYATLAEEDKTKYNAVVEEMFRHKYSKTKHSHEKDAEAVTVDIVQIADENLNPQPRPVSKPWSLSQLLIIAVLFLFAIWSVRALLHQDLSKMKSSVLDLIELSGYFIFLSFMWFAAVSFLWFIISVSSS